VSIRGLSALVIGLGAVVANALVTGGATATDPGVTLEGPLLLTAAATDPASCPVIGEPAVAVTSAGRWAAYNTDEGAGCGWTSQHFTGLQLVPPGGAAPRLASLKPDAGATTAGDPALAPDPRHPGGVFLADLELKGVIQVAVFAVGADLTATPLPSPSVDQSDDKEFIATDGNPKSRWFGRLYLVWDDLGANPGTKLRAWDGTRWLPPVDIVSTPGHPDVAVAPDGTVAVAYRVTGTAASGLSIWTGAIGVRVSHDGGATFSPEVQPITGTDPGRIDPACTGRNAVGQRQRVTAEPRVAWDRAGTLHVVAPIQPLLQGGLPMPGAATGGAGAIEHVSSRDGVNFTAPITVANPAGFGSPVAPVQFNPAIAANPNGGVTVEWLQTAVPDVQYNAYLAVLAPGASGFGPPVLLSDAPSVFPPAEESRGNSVCYGTGDYTGLATTSHGVVAVWPSNAATPGTEVDVMMRGAVLGAGAGAAGHRAVSPTPQRRAAKPPVDLAPRRVARFGPVAL
jgi:hypothetical protein